MEWVGLFPVQLGAFGLLLSIIGWGFHQIVTGKLIPKSTYDALKAASDEALVRLKEENKEWKAAYHQSETTKAEAITQVSAFLEVARTQEAVLRSVKELSK